MSGFEVEDFCVDLAYWFKSSTKRKNMLHEFCVFCDTTYMEVRAFIRKLMSKFLKPAAFRTTSLESVDLQDQENQLQDTQLGIGLTTKSTLIRLHEAGEIPSGDFNKAARGFLLRSTEYALKKLPLNDPLLPHAEFIQHLLPFEDPREQDRISDEFLEYQMLEETVSLTWSGKVPWCVLERKNNSFVAVPVPVLPAAVVPGGFVFGPMMAGKAAVSVGVKPLFAGIKLKTVVEAEAQVRAECREGVMMLRAGASGGLWET
ncbi:hypothetical protein KUCAC02_029413, partial [Chaenocephalus aceratus]